jgi:hypothetical protein
LATRIKGRIVAEAETEAEAEYGAEKDIASKVENVTSGWRKINNDDLHDLYSTPFIIRILK